ncbi:activator of basal transcription 1-like [Liolophura sinensis]|uniref:activator of basal transcription 1-like n=1 Tax=Liolophura sinensis TaxID=3198878 RepID=UPI0031583F8F
MADGHEECSAVDNDKNGDEMDAASLKTVKKTTEPGIIYLSKIPQYMSVKKIKQIFEHYGELGRVFLQPDDKATGSKKGRLFTEGWVEYQDKRVAKRVALSLNNSPIGGKRHSQWHDQIWNIKYLHRFKWTHLNERLAYEKAVHQQRLRTEISQVKRETNFHIQNMEKSQRLKKKALKEQKRTVINDKTGEVKSMVEKPGESTLRKPYEIKQRQTEEEILSRKRKKEESVHSEPYEVKSAKKPLTKKPVRKQPNKKSFLKHIFSGGLTAEED